MTNNLIKIVQWSVLLFIVLATWATAQSSQTGAATLIRAYWSKITGTNDIQNDNIGNVIINSNLGIGTTTPTQRLQIDGALRLKPTGSTQQPSCSVSTAGSIWYKNTASGQKDQFEVCLKDQNNVYGWVTMGCSV
jgi:hypothetical protein